MSLIQEALRRKSEGSVPPPPVTLSASAPPQPPPPLPSTPGPTTPPPAPSARIGLVVLLGIVLLGAALGVLYWLVWQARSVAQKPSTPAAVVRVKSTPPQPKSGTEPAQPPAPIPAATAVTVAAVAPPVAPPAATNTLPPAIATNAPPAPPEPKKIVAAPPAPAIPPPVQPRVHWPRLTINGIVAPRNREGVAFINQRQLVMGERVEGARVLQIKEDSVLLEFQGETNTLRIGQSTF